MSRIYFHNKEKLAEVAGTERHFMGRFTEKVAVAAVSHLLEEWGEETSVFRSVVPRWAQTSGSDFEKTFRLVLQDGKMGGHGVFSLQLNTVMRVGSDVLRLMARLHGQCEVHAYVEGPNRAWLADLIERGMKSHLFRTGAGWESVVDLLREDDTTAVSQSITIHAAYTLTDAILSVLEYDTGEQYEEFPFAFQDGQMLLIMVTDRPAETPDGFHIFKE